MTGVTITSMFQYIFNSLQGPGIYLDFNFSFLEHCNKLERQNQSIAQLFLFNQRIFGLVFSSGLSIPFSAQTPGLLFTYFI